MITRYIRVTNAERLKDRFLTAQVLRPTDEEKLGMGRLMAVVEIDHPWFSASQIGQTVINSFQRHYFNSDSSSDLINFENAVKATNNLLWQIAQNGETEWVGKLNAVILLAIDETIHFASTGNAKVLLLRDGKMTEINQENDESEPHPLKTFGAITSGVLKTGDMTILTNNLLTETLDSIELKSLISDLAPIQAAENIITKLKHQRSKPFNFIILEATSEEAAALSELPATDHLYIDESAVKIHQAVWKFLKKYGGPAFSKLYIFSKGAWHRSRTFTRTKVLPRAADNSRRALHFTTRLVKKGTEHLPVLMKRGQTRLSGGINRIIEKAEKTPAGQGKGPAISPSQNLVGKTLFTIHDYETLRRLEKKKNYFYKTLAFILRGIRKIFSAIGKTILFLFNPKNRKLLIVLGIIFLALILASSIKWQKGRQESKKTNTSQKQQIDEATAALEKAKNALVFNQKDEAKKSYGEALQKIMSIDSQSPYYKQAGEIKKQAQDEYDKLSQIKRLTDAKPIINATTGVLMTNFGGQLYFFDRSSKTLKKYNQDLAAETILTLESEAGLLKIAKNSAKELIYLQNSQAEMWEINYKNKTAGKIAPKEGNKFEKATDLKIFADSIYLLNSEQKQIWKYQVAEKGFVGAKKYLNNSDKIDKAISLAIDGNVYVLLSEAKVLKYTKGNPQDFTLRNIPEPFNKIEKPVAIATDENSSSIFILDSGAQKRLLEFSKTGDYQKQFILDNVVSDLADMAVDFVGRTAWLATDTEVYKIGL